jgi:hypothetical protein
VEGERKPILGKANAMADAKETKKGTGALDRNGRRLVRETAVKQPDANRDRKCIHCQSESGNEQTRVCTSCREKPLCVKCSSNYAAAFNRHGLYLCWPCRDKTPCESCPNIEPHFRNKFNLQPHLRNKSCSPSAPSPFVSGWVSCADTPCVGSWWCEGCWWCIRPKGNVKRHIQCNTCCAHVVTRPPAKECWFSDMYYGNEKVARHESTHDLLYCDECWQQLLLHEDEVLGTYPLVDYTHPGLDPALRTDLDEFYPTGSEGSFPFPREPKTKAEAEATCAWRTQCNLSKIRWRRGEYVDICLPPSNLLMPQQARTYEEHLERKRKRE